MLKLSIIIPVYDVEQYVEKCIVSCAAQNVSFLYEIIIVNDGSRDRSLEIAEEVAGRYNNIFIVSQSNAGLSAARNKGLALAKGEYVWFVDSDDWIDDGFLEGILEELNGIDVLAMGYRRIKNNRIITVDVCCEDVDNGRQLLTVPMEKLILPAQFYIYKRSFLETHKLHFMQGVFHEDIEFTPRMLYYARNLKVSKIKAYNLLQREGSITQSVNPKKAFDLLKVAASLSRFSAAKAEAPYKSRFSDLASLALNMALGISLMMDTDDSRRFSDFFYDNRELIAELKKSSVIKYRVEGRLFSLFPKNCTEIYFFMMKVKTLFHK
ncbi:glycosyltransferase [uncultured Bacteroides sp.]|uniref:glycosyltransferase n=1 Tax=uncultured Bacteroides sp. TaxID=162156 RepID=UPI002AAAC6B8|nr:glycosyltransferase [uncultured Bacteroides sp.]